MMRTAVRALVPAVLTAAVLTGCSAASDEGGSADTKPADTTSSAGAADAGADTAEKAVPKGSTLGGPGSPCVLPVTFDLAADWKPKAVTVDPDSELGEAFAKQGPVTLVCEIDAKPAGNIGYLRVWKGDASDSTPRQVLEAFMADAENAEDTGKITYKEIKAGAVPATEVGYTVSSELLDEPKTERAFALTTPDGPVVVHLGGLDSQEHQEMLPAYELAKKTVRLG